MTPNEETQDAIFARIDERTKTIQVDVADLKAHDDELRAHIETKYVTKERYTPVERVVYGLVGLALTAVVTGLITLVVKGSQ